MFILYPLFPIHPFVLNTMSNLISGQASLLAEAIYSSTVHVSDMQRCRNKNTSEWNSITSHCVYHYVLPSLLPVKNYLLSSSTSGLLAHSSHTTSLNITKNTKQQNKFRGELLRQLPQKIDATNCQAIYFVSKHASDKILKIAFH